MIMNRSAFSLHKPIIRFLLSLMKSPFYMHGYLILRGKTNVRTVVHESVLAPLSVFFNDCVCDFVYLMPKD